MPVASSYPSLFGPLVAAAALGLIVLICRWVFATDHRDGGGARRREEVLAAGDYGLLVPVSTVRTRDDAEMLRGVLAGAGLRAGVSAGALPGEHVVLVFSKDLARARQLVSAS